MVLLMLTEKRNRSGTASMSPERSFQRRKVAPQGPHVFPREVKHKHRHPSIQSRDLNRRRQATGFSPYPISFVTSTSSPPRARPLHTLPALSAMKLHSASLFRVHTAYTKTSHPSRLWRSRRHRECQRKGENAHTSLWKTRRCDA